MRLPREELNKTTDNKGKKRERKGKQKKKREY